MNVQQSVASTGRGTFHQCRSQTALCCIPWRSFIISLNSDRNENLSTVRHFCTWQWDDNTTLHTGLANCTLQEDHKTCKRTQLRPPVCTHISWSGAELNCLQGLYKQKVRYGKTELHNEGKRVRFPIVSLKLIIDLILLAALSSWGQLSP